MQKISTCLWFDNEAEEAAKFYISVFENGKVGATARYDEAGAKVSGQPAGSVMTVEFEIEGQHFTALNGGPIFTFTPAISFSVHCKDAAEVNKLWENLIDGGKALMELGEYPFSKRYGWLSDKYGVSWQLNAAPRAQKITPSLMFVQENAGKAEEAMKFYTSLFPNSKMEEVHHYEEGSSPVDPVTSISHAVFTLCGQDFIAMDSAHDHKFNFNEAVSLIVHCNTQEEIDTYWNALSAHKESEQCGWLKDKYGVSWQIVPTAMGKMMSDRDPAKGKRVMEVLLAMKKLDIKKLEEAYNKE